MAAVKALAALLPSPLAAALRDACSSSFSSSQSSSAASRLEELAAAVEAALHGHHHFKQVVGELVNDVDGPCAKRKEEAERLHQAGNGAFRGGGYESAAALYSQALQHTRPSDRLQAVLYGNRAACLKHMSLLREAERDCTRAMAADSRYAKVYLRRGLIRAALCDYENALRDVQQATVLEGKTDDAEYQAQLHRIQAAMQLAERSKQSDATCTSSSETIDRHHPAVDNVTSVHDYPGMGRGLRVDEVVEAGRVVMEEYPFGAVLLKPWRTSRCHHCFSPLPPSSPLPCDGCATALFCRERCRDAATSSSHEGGDGRGGEHVMECGGGNWGGVMPVEVVLACRVVAKQVTLLDNRDIDLCWDIASLHEDEVVDSFVLACVATACVNHSLQHRHNNSNSPTSSLHVSSVFQTLCMLRANAIAITTLLESNDSNHAMLGFRQERIAQALYIHASMVNHSCDPNAMLTFGPCGVVRVRAICNIPAGNQLFISYGPQRGEHITQQRRQLLLEQYCFLCQCEACSAARNNNIADMWFDGFACGTPGCDGVLPSNTPQVVSAPHTHIFAACSQCGREADIHQLSIKAQAAQRRLNEAILTQNLNNLSSSLGLLQQLLHQYNRQLARAQDNVAEALCKAGRFSEAIPHLEASIDILTQHYPASSVVVEHERVKVAFALVAAGERERAAQEAREALRVMKMHYGEELGEHATWLELMHLAE